MAGQRTVAIPDLIAAALVLRVQQGEPVSVEVADHIPYPALAAAGLPVIVPGLNTLLAGGAEVDIDDGADTAGGVFAAWHPSPRVQECTIRAVRLWLLDDPIVEHSGQIAAAMMEAMATILASAGVHRRRRG